MNEDVIDAAAIEVIEPRSVAVVQQPGQALVATTNDPAGMVAVATQLANVLKDIVDKRKLYADIQGKRYPTVEAWMTIARLDNVVAREARPPIRHDDGAFEAYAELVRLSDGMVIGAASALCGGPDDEPWGGTPPKYGKPAKGPRPEHARRSMAATRAISRAFRGQYSWIMALAGYEPTPAEEMPRDDEPTQRATGGSSTPVARPSDETVTMTGRVTSAGNRLDLSLRQTPDGSLFGFKLLDVEGHPRGNRSCGVRILGPLADALATVDDLEGSTVTVTGRMQPESFDKSDGQTVNYQVLYAEHVAGADFRAPATVAAPAAVTHDDIETLQW